MIMQLESIVPRTFDATFIFLDLAFLTIWVVLLLRRRHVKPLIFGLFGFFVYFVADYVVWYSTLGSRVFYSLPTWLSPLTFLLYFSMTYGIIQFSYVILMFSERQDLVFGDGRDRIAWSVLLFGGWLTIGLLSQVLAIGQEVAIARIMSEQRIVQVAMIAAEYVILIILTYMKKLNLTWKTVLLIFGVGVFVHFSMEFTLLLSGIRDVNLFNLLFNSLIEFNTGAPILYLLLYGLAPRISRLRGDSGPASEG
jgi:hypothetical protein